MVGFLCVVRHLFNSNITFSLLYNEGRLSVFLSCLSPLYVHKCSVAKSCPAVCDPMDLQPTRLLCPWVSPDKNTGVGCHFLLQGIVPAQGSNPSLPCLLHWQVDSLPLSHLGSSFPLCSWIISLYWLIRFALNHMTNLTLNSAFQMSALGQPCLKLRWCVEPLIKVSVGSTTFWDPKMLRDEKLQKLE